MQSFRHFFRMDTSYTNKTNKFIPYHLIISKTKYYKIKRYIFHDLFMPISFCDVWVVYDVWVLHHRSMDSKIHPIFQPIEKLVTWEIKWYNFPVVKLTKLEIGSWSRIFRPDWGSCETIALWENCVGRPESYDSFSAKSCVFLVHELWNWYTVEPR
jgi:hypothetical protein